MKQLSYILTAFLLTVLLGSSCTVKNQNLASEVYTIRDAYWMLMSLEGLEVPTNLGTRTAYIRFQENENDVHGFTGCNKFSGSYTENPEAQTLELADLSATEVACPDMEMENKLMRVLERVDAYRLSDNILTLYDNDKAVATFITGTRRSLDLEVQDELIAD
ncbi:heat shock protein HslJ [Pontibacter ummariensis]|uniref:Heat shock protein HslJ n=1 Tax=Pontibacter ummariensis TaxID=1610492 RepID=A0A239KL26_9BACT|nr:META domain-containing protein [Pontibacter ummariensis]PRY05697.1 heat shock protein HslJ [Pontibacter ummariensis]SNT18398.1 Heat shock protein HslJ [Pontibacter ummariensis]